LTLALHDVLPSVAASLGVPGFTNSMQLPRSDRYVVCLIDGLGWVSLQEHAADAPFLHDLGGQWIVADFPTTTPVGLASLGTGLPTGEHGFVGASFWLPETGTVLAPLHWPSDVSVAMVQPEPTIFEVLSRHNQESVSIGAGDYAQSGLTRAVLRGSSYRAADSAVEVVHQAGQSAAACTYVYWSALDRVGHAEGTESEEWRTQLRVVDALVRDITRAVMPGTTIIVTADHGMFDTDAAHRRPIDESPFLRQGVRCIAGEPRLRHIYFDNAVDETILDIWRTELGETAEVLTRAEAAPLFGAIAPGVEERIGDLVCVARDRWVLTSHVDPRVSGFPGQHGALSDAERQIPGIVIST